MVAKIFLFVPSSSNEGTFDCKTLFSDFFLKMNANISDPDLVNLTELTPASPAVFFSLQPLPPPPSPPLQTSQLGKEAPSQERLILKINIFMLRIGLELVFSINFFMN